MRKQAAKRQSEILGVLRSSDAPMTAYQVLEELQAEEPDIAPPTVYRALAALTEQGRAHRLESIKAFVPCRCDHATSLPVLAICEDCGLVDEHDGGVLLPELTAMVAENNFKPERHIVEIHGQCGKCAG
jgi:Fur family zinc uptake transcriptional regulator